MDGKEFIKALKNMAKDLVIDEDYIFASMEQALITAYKKNFHSKSNVKVEINKETGDIKVYTYYVVVDDYIRYEWERIPHFFYNFYVYKYATGLSAACYIVDSILNKKENALSNYIKFLSSGGSDYPIEELKQRMQNGDKDAVRYLGVLLSNENLNNNYFEMNHYPPQISPYPNNNNTIYNKNTLLVGLLNFIKYK